MAKKIITVALQSRELKYDIMGRLHEIGEARRESGLDFRLASQIEATEGDREFYHLTRSVGHALHDAKSELGEYLRETQTAADDRLSAAIEGGEALELTFHVPDTFDESGTDSVADGLHEYVVARSLTDWLSPLSKDDAALYAAKAQAALAQTRLALDRRTRPERPQYDD